MENEDLRNLLSLLNKKYKQTDSIFHEIAWNLGISDSVFWILYVLSEPEAEYTQYSLGHDWFYSKQTIHSAIGSLVRCGYVCLEETNENRGQKRIRLTETGKEFTRETIQKVKEAEMEALAAMEEEERKEFLRLTDKYLNAFHASFRLIRSKSSED